MAGGVDGYGADGSLFMAPVMLGRVFGSCAVHAGFVLGFADQFFRPGELDSLAFCKALRALGDEHHVWAAFENLACKPNGIPDALQSGRGASAKRPAVHDDGIAFNTAVQIEVRAVTGVEDGIVFEDHDGSLDGVQRGTALGNDGPARRQSAVAAGFASVHGFVRNVPGAAVNDESRLHDQRIAEKNENGKWKFEM